MTATPDDLIAHVAYFANLLAIHDFFMRAGMPAPTHITTLVAAAESRMEELTKDPKPDETRTRDFYLGHLPQGQPDREGGQPSRGG